MERKTITYEGVKEFLEKESYEDADHRITVPRSLLDMRLVRKEAHTLIIFFSGAMDRTKFGNPPFYTGNHILPHLSASRLLISDTIFNMDETISAGWYMGHREFNLQKTLPEIINSIIEKHGYRKIIVVGGSAGGFASMFYARSIRDSITLVWNPQTDLERYFRSQIENYLRVAFPGEEHIPKDYVNPSLAELHKNTDENGTVLYMQNMPDKHHVEEHMNPFLKELGLDPPKERFSGTMRPGFLLHLDEWGEGHAWPPRESLARVLESIAKEEGDWKDILEPGRFRKEFDGS